MASRIVPLTRLARDPDFQIVVRLKRSKEGDARSTARIGVQVRDGIIGAQADIPAQIQGSGITGAIGRTRPIDAVNGVIENVAFVAQWYRPKQLRAYPAAGKNIAR